MAVLCTCSMPSICLHVHRQFMRNELHDLTTIAPITVYYQGSYVETYSRSIGRWRPLALRCELSHAAMHGRNGRTRCAQRHALDHLHEFRRELAMAWIGSCGSDQTSQPGGAVSGKPPLHGTEWDTGITGRLRQRDTVVEVGPQHRKTPHGLLALFLGACGQSRFHVWLLIHGAHTTPSPVHGCPQEGR